MNLSVGIVGLPNAGKSTLFNALLAKQIANVAPYPFCTIDPNVGIVEVPDDRLEKLADIIASSVGDPSVRTSSLLRTERPPIIPAVVRFVDIAGLVAGAAKGEGLGNQFLANIRECQAIAHILRAFDDADVARKDQINPQSDFEIIKTELCLADLQTLEKQREPRPLRSTPEEKKRWEAIKKVKANLEQGIEVQKMNLNEEEKGLIKELFLLTQKSLLFVLNINEKEIGLSEENLREKYGLSPEINFIPICAKIEMELAALNDQERKDYLKELGLSQSGLEKMIQACYSLLGLQTYLTAGEKPARNATQSVAGWEVRAWTINSGDKAPQAAGVIHTDFEKGFIKAKIVSYQDFVSFKGWKGAAEVGKVRLEGKDYVMQEGDVVEFMFNL